MCDCVLDFCISDDKHIQISKKEDDVFVSYLTLMPSFDETVIGFDTSIWLLINLKKGVISHQSIENNKIYINTTFNVLKIWYNEEELLFDEEELNRLLEIKEDIVYSLNQLF